MCSHVAPLFFTVPQAIVAGSAIAVPNFSRKQKPAQPAKKKKDKKEKKEPEEDTSRDLAEPPVEKKAPHPFAIMDKEAKSPFVGDAWKKVNAMTRKFNAGMNTCKYRE